MWHEILKMAEGGESLAMGIVGQKARSDSSEAQSSEKVGDGCGRVRWEL